VCLVGLWCALVGSRRDAVAFLAGALVLFTAEWIWFNPDPGWGSWIAGTILVVLVGRLGRRQIDLVAQLEEAQAGLAERARAEERNRIGRDLHDVIAHTLTVALLHITSARLAVEYDPDDAARALAEAERLARESLDEVRLVVGTLHQGPDGGRTRPLPGAEGLPSLVDRFRSAGVDVTLATAWEREQVDRLGLQVTSGTALAADPSGSALAALGGLPAGPLAVHVDVDVLDFIDAPLAENTDCRNTGPTLDQLGQALLAAAGDPRLRALSIGELNPSRSAGAPDAIPRFIRMLAATLRVTAPSSR
jgi:hypothetical protein